MLRKLSDIHEVVRDGNAMLLLQGDLRHYLAVTHTALAEMPKRMAKYHRPLAILDKCMKITCLFENDPKIFGVAHQIIYDPTLNNLCATPK